jgi:hypothetical protein
MLHQQGSDHPCYTCIKLHVGCCFPEKMGMDGAARQERMSAFPNHSCGSTFLLFMYQDHRQP